ncbi:MAG: hypothetical protein KW788_02595 [Candidatus Doudnabacteria bacterium]|nr:hypothetical protein [Candidatus Doudnabacteria bacterium]
MKSKTKLSGLILCVIFAAGFLVPEMTQAATCSAETLKFFPVSKISQVIGNVQSTSQSYNTCNYKMSYPQPDGIATATVYSFDSPTAASNYFNSQYSNLKSSWTKLGIGDESYFKYSGGGVAKKGKYVFSIKWYCYCTQGTRLSQSQAQALLGYSASQVSGDTVPVAEDKPAPPVIKSISPTSVFAGKKLGLNTWTGFVYYTNNFSDLKITGENLQGVSVSFGSYGQTNLGDPIYLIGKSISTDGKQLTATLVTQNYVKAGKLKLTLTNKQGSDSTDINVLITGYQYLNRRFQGTGVTFRGEWPQAAPNADTDEIEQGVVTAMTAINLPAYQRLGLDIRIYSKDYWNSFAEKANCYTQGLRSGCSSDHDRVIHAAWISKTTPTWDKLGSTILHEAAHKLQKYYGNTSFNTDWIKAVGNLSNCQYLPLKNGAWNNGETNVPHCGFVESYSATRGAQTFGEDVATMTETLVFYPNKKTQGDWPTDPHYKAKEQLLRQYGFIK